MTTPVPASAWDQLHAALQTHHPVWVSYHGRQRLVCPHALSWKANRPMLLAYQTSGQTSTGALPTDPHHGWRCFSIDQIDDLDTAGPDTTWVSANTYNPARPFPAIDQLSAATAPITPVR